MDRATEDELISIEADVVTGCWGELLDSYLAVRKSDAPQLVKSWATTGLLRLSEEIVRLADQLLALAKENQ